MARELFRRINFSDAKRQRIDQADASPARSPNPRVR